MTTSEPTLSSLAWLTVSTTVHDIPPAVSEQASVVNEASVLLLVLDAPPDQATASLAEEERCKVEGTRCRAGMPRHSLKNLRAMTLTMPFPSVPDQPLLWYFTGNLSRLFEVADEPATTFRVPDPNDPAGIGVVPLSCSVTCDMVYTHMLRAPGHCQWGTRIRCYCVDWL
ncbi:hypothetical protein EDB85DRAFT_1892808 [Lactarius pseudohatsudake]|nr:hypothetical protein EDB85DRAFT_1892808 [Lactarius pseudohatsudake]